MSPKKRIMAILVIMTILLSMIMPVYADDLSEKQQQLQDVSSQINSKSQKVNSLKKQEKSIMGQVNALEKDMNKTQQEIENLTNRAKLLQSNIGVTEHEINILENDLDQQSEILSDRLVFIYEEGDISYLEVLLSAEDLQDFLTRYDLLNRILDQDRQLIDTIRGQKRDLDLKKSELVVQKKSLESAKVGQVQKEQLLDTQIDKKKDILNSVEKEKNAQLKALNELEQESKQLESLIRQMQGGGSKNSIGTGTYSWPVPGYTGISSPYGMRFHPILKVRKLHTGIDIRVPYGVSIHAADGGKVIYAGWMNAYGQVVIIDHGAGMSTLYAHQSSILVSNGTMVSKGQVIGKVGSTGWSTGAHLHFEVRVNGTPVNPNSYV